MSHAPLHSVIPRTRYRPYHDDSHLDSVCTLCSQPCSYTSCAACPTKCEDAPAKGPHLEQLHEVSSMFVCRAYANVHRSAMRDRNQDEDEDI
jgi:hypothetical protein